MLEDQLPYDEPPIWPNPGRESLGGELLRQGRAQEAVAVFRQDLVRHPRNGRSLFGLWKGLETTGAKTEADVARREFQSAWATASVQLSVDDL